MPTPLWILIIAVAAVLCFLLGILYRKKVAEREIASAEEEAKRIINESIKSAESKKREALVEAKEEIHKNRSEYEREVKERRAELQKQERRLQQKEESLVGKRMLLCQTEETGKLERVVAVDLVGAGVGSEVLVSRQYGGAQGYIDLYIIGIVDMISEG